MNFPLLNSLQWEEAEPPSLQSPTVEEDRCMITQFHGDSDDSDTSSGDSSSSVDSSDSDSAHECDAIWHVCESSSSDANEPLFISSNQHSQEGLTCAAASAWLSSSVEVGATATNPFNSEECLKYHWDPKITTPPGLYFITCVLYHIMAAPFGHITEGPLLLLSLRSVNLLFSGLTFFVLKEILEIKGIRKEQVGLHTWVIMSFSLLYFYNFLYYTDIGSTLFVLCTLLATFKGQQVHAALYGMAAFSFRQTNVVWVAYCAALVGIKHVMETLQCQSGDRNTQLGDLELLKATFWLLLDWRFIFQMFRRVWAYAIVALLVLLFIVINDGIVLGDKTNHTAVFHAPQILYFLFFSLGFGFTFLVNRSDIKDFCFFVAGHPITSVIFVLGSCTIIHLFTCVHPFLQADNRHYVFYLWKRIFDRFPPYSRFFPAFSVYPFAAWSVTTKLRHRYDVTSSSATSDTILHFLLLFMATCAVLIPQCLLEPRYFIIPYLLLRIHLAPALSTRQLYLELAVYTGVNLAMIYTFVEKPFYWPNSTDVQRFML